MLLGDIDSLGCASVASEAVAAGCPPCLDLDDDETAKVAGDEINFDPARSNVARDDLIPLRLELPGRARFPLAPERLAIFRHDRLAFYMS